MSTKHPIISVVGSSGAGTSTVKDTFEKIFLRENVSAAMIEGDAFHKFNRTEMKAELVCTIENAMHRAIQEKQYSAVSSNIKVLMKLVR